MRQFQYRKARANDIPRLAALFKQVYFDTYATEGITTEFTNFTEAQFSRDNINAQITNSKTQLWVATHQDHLVGVLQLDKGKSCPTTELTAPEINKLYILQRFRSHGIGQQLMHLAHNYLTTEGSDKAWVWVLDSNHRAIHFYQEQGYQHIGQAPFKMEVNTYMNCVMLKQWS